MNKNANFGDISISKILLVSDGGAQVDLTGLSKYISIFEDVFSNGMSGFIKMRDSYNLPETFPIVGEERIEFRFTSYSKDINNKTEFSKIFKVHKISDYALEDSNDYSTYIIHFVSVPFFLNFTKRLNRSFGSEEKTMKSSEIVSLVCTKMLNIPQNELKLDETRFERHVICSNWTPFQLFNFLGESDILSVYSEATDKESTLLFFEDRDGFKFISWATLIEDLLVKEKEIDELRFTLAPQNKSTSESMIEARQVIRFSVKELSQALKNIRSGMFNNRYIYHDIIKKTLTQRDFDYGNEFDKMSHVDGRTNSYGLNTHRIIDTKESTSLVPREYHFANDIKTKRPWKQIAKARAMMFENFVIEAEVVGNTGHKLGNVVKCNVPSSRKNSDSSVANYTQLSGKYIITKIRHNIDNDGYYQVLELRKGAQQKV